MRPAGSPGTAGAGFRSTHEVNYTGKVARGAASELIASAHLMAQGYHVFRALASSCPCDLVAYRTGETPLRVEVKSVMTPPAGTKNSSSFSTPANHEWDILILVSNIHPIVQLPYDPSAANLRAAYRKAVGLPPIRQAGPRTHCARGHEYTPDNVRMTPGGTPACRACARWRYKSKSLTEPLEEAS